MEEEEQEEEKMEKEERRGGVGEIEEEREERWSSKREGLRLRPHVTLPGPNPGLHLF